LFASPILTKPHKLIDIFATAYSPDVTDVFSMLINIARLAATHGLRVHLYADDTQVYMAPAIQTV